MVRADWLLHPIQTLENSSEYCQFATQGPDHIVLAHSRSRPVAQFSAIQSISKALICGILRSLDIARSRIDRAPDWLTPTTSAVSFRLRPMSAHTVSVSRSRSVRRLKAAYTTGRASSLRTSSRGSGHSAANSMVLASGNSSARFRFSARKESTQRFLLSVIAQRANEPFHRN